MTLTLSGHSTLASSKLLLTVVPPAFLTLALWTISPNPVQIEAAVCALSMLLIPWGSFLSWKYRNQRGLPVFAMISGAYWVYFSLGLFEGTRTLSLLRPTRIDETAVTYAEDMALLGVLCIWAGMRLPVRLWVPARQPTVVDLPKHWSYIRLIMILTTIAGFYPASVYWLGDDVRQVLIILETFVPTVAFVLLFRRWLLGHAADWDGRLLVAVGVARIGMGLASGWITPVVSLGITCVGLLMIERRRFPWVPALMIVGVIFFLQVGKGAFRAVYWRDQAEGSVIERVEYWLEASALQWTSAATARDPDRGGALASQALERASLLTQVAHVLDITPSQVAFQNGETYKYLAITLIPRFLWTDKPSVNDANRFYQVAYGLTAPDNLASVSIAVGSLAEAFINFGWLGVICVMCGIGLVLGLCERTCLVAGASPLLMAIGLALLPSLLLIDEQLGQYVGGIVQEVLLAIAVFLPITTQSSASQRLAVGRIRKPA